MRTISNFRIGGGVSLRFGGRLNRPPRSEEVLIQFENQLAETPAVVFLPLLSDYDLVRILDVKLGWVRSHAREIPGFKPLGHYFRFCRHDVEQWLGSLEPLLKAEAVKDLMGVPGSWVYANAADIPGVLRLGRYVRFRPAILRPFLAGSEVVQ